MDSKHNETVEGLISRLTHSKPVVQLDALREVRNLAEVDPQIVAAVRVLSATDHDSMVRKTAAATLSSLGMSPASSDELDLEPQTQSRSRTTADAGLEQINLKARLCPKCGKHNPESDWACRNCGETLATNTLIDLPTPEDALAAPSAPEVPTADTVQALQMLRSNNPTRRHEACEELRVAESLSPQAIEALRQATADPNEGVAGRKKSPRRSFALGETVPVLCGDNKGRSGNL